MPEVGGHSIVLGGDGQPICVIRTTEVRVLPFREVDEAFAWDEGEGDRSLAYWLDAHIAVLHPDVRGARRGVRRGDGDRLRTVRLGLAHP